MSAADEFTGVTDGRAWGARRFALLVAAGLALIGALFVVHLCTGTVRLGPDEALAALLGRHTEELHRTVVWELRLPRSLIAIVAGALLGTAGAVLQIVMRNNLAEPGITGVTAGGILVAVLWTVGFAGLPHPGSLMPLVVLLGCLSSGAIVFALSWRDGIHPLRMVLSGVLVSAILASVTSFIMLRAQAGVGGVLPWIIGTLNGRVWVHWEQLWPWAVMTLPLVLLSVRPLNLLQLGDNVAASKGMRVNLTRAALFCPRRPAHRRRGLGCGSGGFPRSRRPAHRAVDDRRRCPPPAAGSPRLQARLCSSERTSFLRG